MDGQALQKLRVRFTLDLHPVKLNSVEKGVKELLNGLLLRCGGGPGGRGVGGRAGGRQLPGAAAAWPPPRTWLGHNARCSLGGAGTTKTWAAWCWPSPTRS